MKRKGAKQKGAKRKKGTSGGVADEENRDGDFRWQRDLAVVAILAALDSTEDSVG